MKGPYTILHSRVVMEESIGPVRKALLIGQLPHEGKLPGMKQHFFSMPATCHLAWLVAANRRG